MTKHLGILTGGGDVSPLNAVLHAAQAECRKMGIRLVGFRNGWQGVLDRAIVDLTNHLIDPSIGGTILRSSRVNLRTVPGGPDTVRSAVDALGLDGIIVIGGEDTLSNPFLLPEIPQVLISKTIDNDVGFLPSPLTPATLDSIINVFTLGHPTAARAIASFVSLDQGLRTTAYAHERIIIVESMGMHAGWLALSSSQGNPDFIVIPEFGIDYSKFVEDVARTFRKQKHVIAVVAEGARWSNGSYVSADESEKDDFGHPRFKGAAALLAGKLKQDLRSEFDTRNVNSVNPSYLYRSGAPCDLDQIAAAALGREAVRHLGGGSAASVFLALTGERTGFVPQALPLAEVRDMEYFHRFIGPEFYDAANYAATDLYGEFARQFSKKHPNPMYGI